MTSLVASFYRFTRLSDPHVLRAEIEACGRAAAVSGSILLAQEGVNGMIAGPPAGVASVLSTLRRLPGCADLPVRESHATRPPFARLKVRVKREIVAFGVPSADPATVSGIRIAPQDWNDLISRPDIVLIDARNSYETAIGSFQGATLPGTARFRDFPGWWQAARDEIGARPVAMFCTGGIRCEKTTSLILQDRGGEVYHLDGGILGYLDQVAPQDSLWQGECFVFDGRVAVTHGLAEGRHSLCHACGQPVSPEARTHPDWQPGLSCPACAGTRSAEDLARLGERLRQTRLAQARAGRP